MQRPDILLHLDSYPEPTSMEAIDQAVAFGASLDGVLTALAVHIDIRVPRNKVAEYLVGLSRLADEEEGKSLRSCQQLLAHFVTRAKEAGMPVDTLLERANLYLVGEHVAQRARTRDLCIVPVIDRLDGQRSVAEAVIFDSGRPAIVFSPGVADLPKTGLNTVVLAWDGSRCAARAMADAMPVLTKARKVVVFTAVNEKPTAVSGLGEEAVRYLKRHGVAAVAEQRDAERQPIGEVLDRIVVDVGAGMLVMGAYGRSKLREFILGGATEHVLSSPKVPLLLSH
ncbi:MAG: universal stress protein [Hyphomonadaceae bacterium]|nr:universal stress protein [Hyphomonadaceae bacterium]